MYKYNTFFKWITVSTDFLLLSLALYISFILERKDISFWAEASEHYRFNFLLLILFWFYSSSLVKLYENILTREAVPTVNATLTALVIYMLAPLVLTLTLPRFSLSADFIIKSSCLFSFFILGWKTTFLTIRKSRRKFWIETKKILIVGAGPLGNDLCNYINANPNLGYSVAGVFDDDLQQELPSGNKILGKVDECFKYAHANGVTEVFCALPGHKPEKIKTLMQEADQQMIRFRMVPDLNIFFQRKVMMELYGHMPVLSQRNEPLENKANEILKRGFDILFSLLIIICLLSWLIPLLAIIIKLDSPGPVFFRQLRTGKGNRSFYCYKFRSMRPNKDSDSKQASRGDMRITRVGAILRKTSMDELPQFFNVLLGDMSVVGPRPHMLKHTQDYSLLINNFMVRHFLTPGITGWAQVSGYRGETKETTAMTKRVEADLWYLENWSLLLDLKIIFITIWHLLRENKNAY